MNSEDTEVVDPGEIEIVTPPSERTGGTGRIHGGPIEPRCYICGRLKSEHVVNGNHPSPIVLERLRRIRQACEDFRRVLLNDQLQEGEKVGYLVAMLITDQHACFATLKIEQLAEHVRVVVPGMIKTLRIGDAYSTASD